MKKILSEDGKYVVVFCDDRDEPEELTVDEFIIIYGEDELPISNIDDEVAQLENVIRYYAALKRVVDAVGDSLRVAKLGRNAADGVYSVKKAAYKYFGENYDAKISLAAHQKELFVKVAIKNFDYWSRRVGFRPMSEKDGEVLVNWLSDKKFRNRLRRRITKYRDGGKLVSIRDLVVETAKAARQP